uniref:Uncharacterized protein n=1 Tax=Anguilla anguilla TaxID=7936 RepID=A0A0E9QN76_ANGAN
MSSQENCKHCWAEWPVLVIMLRVINA